MKDKLKEYTGKKFYEELIESDETIVYCTNPFKNRVVYERRED